MNFGSKMDVKGWMELFGHGNFETFVLERIDFRKKSSTPTILGPEKNSHKNAQNEIKYIRNYDTVVSHGYIPQVRCPKCMREYVPLLVQWLQTMVLTKADLEGREVPR